MIFRVGFIAAVLLLAPAAHAQVRTAGTIAAENLAHAPGLSPTMKTIFTADQADRSGDMDFERVMKADAARRKETSALLAADKLTSAADDEAAAFIFQHGSTSDSYLLAHTLAIAAMAKGRAGASWIAAASLDRYLSSIQHPQIYGTQFSRPPGQTWSQEPYDRTLIPEGLLKALGMPNAAEQEARLKAMNAVKP